MKIVIAPDKFKGSLTGIEFCNAVEEGVKAVLTNVEVVKLPLADGGDGTIEVVDFYLKGTFVEVIVSGPFFQPVKAHYLYSETSKVACIEMAEAAGIKLLNPEQLDCKNATTLGVGELLLDAINKGAKDIILGIGGSATNDCGIGMAKALGYRFLDKNNQEVKPIGTNLSQIKTIDASNVCGRLFDVSIDVACDVKNPLYGKNGAAHVYAKQKGATTGDIKLLDKGLRDFSKVVDAIFHIDSQSVEGAGAAGGMGIASNVFLKGILKPGIELIKNLADFDNAIEGADWIITGEGKLDNQTLSGKTVQGVLASAKAKNIKLAAFCGSNDLDEKTLDNCGIDYTDAIMQYTESIEDAMAHSYNYIKEMAIKFAKSKARLLVK